MEPISLTTSGTAQFRGRAASLVSNFGGSFRRRGSTTAGKRGSYSVSSDGDRPRPVSQSFDVVQSAPGVAQATIDPENMPLALEMKLGTRSRSPPTAKPGKIALPNYYGQSSVEASLQSARPRERPIVDPSERTWFNHVNAQYVGEMEKMIAEEDIHVDRRDYFTTALHWACKFGNKDMLNLCLDNKANTNIRTGCSPLHLASKYGQTAICTELLDAGADANLRDSRGKLAYHVAHKKLPDAVKERLLKGVNHNASKALTLLNIQVKKSSSASSHKISLSTSKGFIGDGDEGSLGPRNKSSWFKRKSAGATVNTSSMPIFNS